MGRHDSGADGKGTVVDVKVWMKLNCESRGPRDAIRHKLRSGRLGLDTGCKGCWLMADPGRCTSEKRRHPSARIVSAQMWSALAFLRLES